MTDPDAGTRGAHDMAARLTALETRLRALEDEREIRDLVTAYGPLVDDGAVTEVADLWTDDGVYDVDGYRMSGRAEIEAMVASSAHQGLIARGCTHFQGPVTVTVSGPDSAVAASYSLLVLREDGHFVVERATAHHWVFTRTPAGWRVVRRTSKKFDGAIGAHRLAADGVRGHQVSVDGSW